MPTDSTIATEAAAAIENIALVGQEYRRQDGFSKRSPDPKKWLEVLSIYSRNRGARGITFHSDFSRSSGNFDSPWGNDDSR